MSEQKAWDKILGDPRRCKWFLHGLCVKTTYIGKIRHIDDFPLCEMRVCEDYEEKDSRADVEQDSK